MVIKEPSENIRKLKEYLNLSTDTVEISLEEQQSLEDVVLADDRERQKRNNAEALSMAIEKSSPLQKLTAFAKADYSTEDAKNYQMQVYNAMQNESTKELFGRFTSQFANASPEQQIQLAHKWASEHDRGAKAEDKTPIFSDDVPTPSDDFEPISDMDWRRALLTIDDPRNQPNAVGQRGTISTSGGSRGRPGSGGGSSSTNWNSFNQQMLREARKESNIFTAIPDGDEKDELNYLSGQLSEDNVDEENLSRMKEILDNHYAQEDYSSEGLMGGGSSSASASTTDTDQEESDTSEEDEGPLNLYRGNIGDKHRQFLDHYANENSPHSEEDVLAHMNEHGERNKNGKNPAGKALDDWAKKFEADNDISGDASAFTPKGARKGWMKSASGTPPENAWESSDSDSGSTESDGEEEKIPDDPDSPVNADLGNNKLDLPDKSYDIDSGKKDAIEFGLFDAETQEPTDLGNAIFDNIQANMEEAEGLYNDNLLNMSGLQQRVSPKGKVGEPRKWNGNVTGTALGHYINNYNARNPENPINRTHDVDDDGNVTRNEDVEENTLGESPTDLSAHELAGAIGAGQAGNQSGVVQAHFLHEGGQDYNFLRGADVEAYSQARPSLPDIPQDEQWSYEDGVNTNNQQQDQQGGGDRSSTPEPTPENPEPDMFGDEGDFGERTPGQEAARGEGVQGEPGASATRQRGEQQGRLGQEIVTPEDRTQEGDDQGSGTSLVPAGRRTESGEKTSEEAPPVNEESSEVPTSEGMPEGQRTPTPGALPQRGTPDTPPPPPNPADAWRKTLIDNGYMSQDEADFLNDDEIRDHLKAHYDNQRKNKGSSDGRDDSAIKEKMFKRLATLKHGKDFTQAQLEDVMDDHEFDDTSELKAAIKSQRNTRDSQRNNERSQVAAREKQATRNIGQSKVNAAVDNINEIENMTSDEATEHYIDLVSLSIQNKHHLDAEHKEGIEKALKQLERNGADGDSVLHHLDAVQKRGIEIGSDEHHAYRQEEAARAAEEHEKATAAHEATMGKIREHLDAAHNDPGFHPNRHSVHDKDGKMKSSHKTSYDEKGKLITEDHTHGDHPEHGEDWNKAGTHSHAPLHLDHTPEQREAYEKLHRAKTDFKSHGEYDYDQHAHDQTKELQEHETNSANKAKRLTNASQKAHRDLQGKLLAEGLAMDKDHKERIKPYVDRLSDSRSSIDAQKEKHQSELDELDSDLQSALADIDAGVEFPASKWHRQQVINDHAARRRDKEVDHAEQMERMEQFHKENFEAHNQEEANHAQEKGDWKASSKEKAQTIFDNTENQKNKIIEDYEKGKNEIREKYNGKIIEHDNEGRRLNDEHNKAHDAAEKAKVPPEHLHHDELGKSPASMKEEHGKCGPPEGEVPPTDADGNPMVWRCGKGRNWVKKENFDAGANAAANGNVAFFPGDEHGGMTAGHGGNMFNVQDADSFQADHGDGLGSEGVMSAALHSAFQQAQNDGAVTKSEDGSHDLVATKYLKDQGIHLDKFGSHPENITTDSGQKIPKYKGARDWLKRMGSKAAGDSATSGGIDQKILGKLPSAGEALRAIRQGRERHITGSGYKAASRGERANDPDVKPSAKRELLRYSPFKGFGEKGRQRKREIHAENAAEKAATHSKISQLQEEAAKRIRGGSDSSSF